MLEIKEIQQLFGDCLLKGNSKQCNDYDKQYLSKNPNVFNFYEEIIKSSL